MDPLDGTKEYVKGELENVTTIVGVSYKSKPIIGLIGKHFSKENMHIPYIYYGYIYVPAVYIYKP